MTRLGDRWRARRERRRLGRGLVRSEWASPGFVRFDLDLSPHVQAAERMEIDLVAPERLAFSRARFSGVDWSGEVVEVPGAQCAVSSNHVEVAFEPDQHPLPAYRIATELIPTTAGLLRAAFVAALLAFVTVTFFGWLVIFEGCAEDRSAEPRRECDYDFPGPSDAAVTVVLVAAGLAGAAFSERASEPLEARANSRIRLWLYLSFTATLTTAAIVAGDVRHDPSRSVWIGSFGACLLTSLVLGVAAARIRRRLRVPR